MTDQYTEHLHRLAKKQLCKGVFYEPRIYYDQYNFGDDLDQTTGSDPGSYRNMEAYPVRITHLTMFMRPELADDQTPPSGSELATQLYGLRIFGHDTAYMNSVFHAALPVWNNKVVSPNDVLVQGTSTWRFEHPFILSSRDAMEVRGQLELTPSATSIDRASIHGRNVTASLDGVGLQTGRPYKLGDTALINDTGGFLLDPDQFRNDGAEPIIVTDLEVVCGPTTSSSFATGDIQQLLVSFRQLGNGTNARWDRGPAALDLAFPPIAGGIRMIPYCPASLYGLTTGRAIVHKLPGQGWLWEPGEGISMDVISYTSAARDETVVVAAAGYIVVS